MRSSILAAPLSESPGSKAGARKTGNRKSWPSVNCRERGRNPDSDIPCSGKGRW